MSKFEQFKRSINLRTDNDGYFNSNYILRINGSIANYAYEKDGFMFVAYKDIKCSDNIYGYEVDENHEYRIERFVLENEDE